MEVDSDNKTHIHTQTRLMQPKVHKFKPSLIFLHVSCAFFILFHTNIQLLAVKLTGNNVNFPHNWFFLTAICQSI